MYYVPYTRLMHDSLVSWAVYAGGAFVLIVAVTVAVREYRERRRLERALAVARQAKPLRKAWTPPPPRGGRGRFWLFPLIAIHLALIVTLWSLWNVLNS